MKNVLKHIRNAVLLLITPFLILILFLTGNYIYVSKELGWSYRIPGIKVYLFDLKELLRNKNIISVEFIDDESYLTVSKFPIWMTILIIIATLTVFILLYRNELIMLFNNIKIKIHKAKDNSSKARIARLEKELEELKKEKEPR